MTNCQIECQENKTINDKNFHMSRYDTKPFEHKLRKIENNLKTGSNVQNEMPLSNKLLND